MSIALDGFEVLRQLGKHHAVFASVRADIDKAARTIVVKCLKSKSVGVSALRDIRKALGSEPFELILEGLKDAEIKSILTRLDKHQSEIKSGTSSWRRQHLQSLSQGSVDAAAPPVKAAKKASAKKTKAKPARLQSDVMDVFKSGKG